MGINFPASPTVGQKHPEPAIAGIPVYTWDGEKWTTVGGSVPAYALPSATLPLVDATPAVIGVGTSYARNDHQHPTDPGIALKVNKAGDYMTGSLVIAASNPALSLTKGVSGEQNVIFGNTAGVPRWSAILGDSAPESSGQLGSNFAIYRYNDAGTTMDAPFSIARTTGNAIFTHDLNVNGNFGTTSINASAGISAAGAISSTGGGITSYGNMTVTNGNGLYLPASASLQSDSSQTALLCLGTSAFLQYAKSTASLAFFVNDLMQWGTTYSGAFSITSQGYKPGGGSWGDNSDARIKNVEGDYPRGLDDVAGLRPVYYTFKGNDTNDPPGYPKGPPDAPERKDAVSVPYPNSPHKQAAVDQKKFAGLIAQEVEAVFPEMVTKHAGYIDGTAVTDMRDLDTTPLVFALINAVKELKARVEALEGA